MIMNYKYLALRFQQSQVISLKHALNPPPKQGSVKELQETLSFYSIFLVNKSLVL